MAKAAVKRTKAKPRTPKASTEAVAKAGRPTVYSDAVAEVICASLMMGWPLVRICTLDSMPSEATVYGWLAQKDHPFSERYARAREIQAERMADELVMIADDTSGDVSGELAVPNSVAVQRARLRVDTRKWVAAKLLPKKYGDRVGVEHSGEVTTRDVWSRISAAEMDAYATTGQLPIWWEKPTEAVN